MFLFSRPSRHRPLSLFLVASALGVGCPCALRAAEPPAPTVAERLGHPRDARLLIIHADDMGGAHSFNRAIGEALEKHWISSASIMVPCPWFPEAARFARAHPDADLGIHLVLTCEWTDYRWGPVSSPNNVPSLVDEDGYLQRSGAAVARHANPAEVEREVRAQIERALKAGIAITHLDSHMGVLFWSKLEFFTIYQRVAGSYGVPILLYPESHAPARNGPAAACADLVDRVVEMHPGVALADWPKTYEAMLAPLPPGVYQLIVHLGYDDEEVRGASWDHPAVGNVTNWGAAWRQADFDLVRSARFQDFLRTQGFIVIGWRELARALPDTYRAGQAGYAN